MREKLAKNRLAKLLQCAGYALEMNSHGGLRTHVIGALIGDRTLELFYYDHSTHALSEQIDFTKMPNLLVAAIHGLLRLDDSGWGYDPILKSPTSLLGTQLPKPILTGDKTDYEIFKRTQFILKDGLVLTLGDEVFHQHALIGRGTIVVKAEVTNHDKDGVSKKWPTHLTVKFSYVACTREQTEHEIVGELCSMAEKEISENPEVEDMRKYLPHIVYSEKHELAGAPARMAECLNAVKEGFYERRVLVVTVQEELYRVEDLVYKKDVANFGKAVKHITKCGSHITFYQLSLILLFRLQVGIWKRYYTSGYQCGQYDVSAG